MKTQFKMCLKLWKEHADHADHAEHVLSTSYISVQIAFFKKVYMPPVQYSKIFSLNCPHYSH